MKETVARSIYADIIDLPHHQSDSRPHMTMNDRAAQFAPFAALSGFEDLVDEETRYTDREKEFEDNALELIDRQLALIVRQLDMGENVTASFTFFKPDERKEGGSYATAGGRVKKIDVHAGRVILFGEDEGPEKLRTTVDIDIGSITAIEIEKDEGSVTVRSV